MNLDLVDRRILDLLQKDGSLSSNEVASKLNMTTPPCWRRIRKLKDEGYLQKQVWIISPEAMNFKVTIYANVRLTTHDKEATTAFREQVQTLPEVQECYILLGASDVLVKVLVHDIKEHEDVFYNHISQLPGVKEVTSSVVLS
ncbi:MAG: Lrp/AsnC family transcriptional regulator, partial [Gammaproteobacteria bacterium]|nr:Lrp/AsnC family transcriptional regulator [Gammaproteobacteria bacterium]